MSDRETLADKLTNLSPAQMIMDAMPLPTGEPVRRTIYPNSLWRHKSGRFYDVTAVHNTPDTEAYPLTITYVGFAGEPTQSWAGKADDWHRRMERIWPLDGAILVADMVSNKHISWDRFGITPVADGYHIIDMISGYAVQHTIVPHAYTRSVERLADRLNHLNHVRYKLTEHLFWKGAGCDYSDATKQADLAMEAVSLLNIRL